MFSLHEIKFLITLHHLNRHRMSSKNKDITKQMNISKTAVSKVSKPLFEKNVIKREIDGNIYFTPKGEAMANEYIEKYDLLFHYFSFYLKLEKIIAHRDSLFCAITLSNESISKIAFECGCKYCNDAFY
ncbi:MAG: MarR family transcriptional regulator [Lachnospiraceae bacterium]|nr:MarR family transcriptional regulator [Lachnospiraceae bacterium]